MCRPLAALALDPWDRFRLEGPSLTWHFRGDPHVHVWAHVASQPDVPFSAIGFDRTGDAPGSPR